MKKWLEDVNVAMFSVLIGGAVLAIAVHLAYEAGRRDVLLMQGVEQQELTRLEQIVEASKGSTTLR